MDIDKAHVTYNRVENSETVSSPHTYAHSKGSAPSSTLPDKSNISNISITSAVAGLPVGSLSRSNNSKTEVGESGFPLTTRRVEKLSFDIQGISPPIANLFRRLVTTEVPTLAFDRILIVENDSVVLDELLSHRIGLIPIAGPVNSMEYLDQQNPGNFSQLDPLRVLLFELDAVGAKDVPVTPVYSHQLVWKPLPGQEAWVNTEVEEQKVFLVHPDIMITKLGPDQRIKLKAIAVKGIGTVHAKWNPVSSCYYEMKTSIHFTEPIKGETAQQLVKACPLGVFDLDSKGEAVVKAVEKCSICRECLRKDAYPQFADKVKIDKDKTCFRFHLESTGQLPVTEIFRSALKLFAERCRELSKTLMLTPVEQTDTNNLKGI